MGIKTSVHRTSTLQCQGRALEMLTCEGIRWQVSATIMGACGATQQRTCSRAPRQRKPEKRRDGATAAERPGGARQRSAWTAHAARRLDGASESRGTSCWDRAHTTTCPCSLSASAPLLLPPTLPLFDPPLFVPSSSHRPSPQPLSFVCSVSAALSWAGGVLEKGSNAHYHEE